MVELTLYHTCCFIFYHRFYAKISTFLIMEKEMPNYTDCTEYRQRVEKILSAVNMIKHGIDLADYITQEEPEEGSTVKTFVVNKNLYLDVCNLAFGSNYAGMADSEAELFIQSCYDAVMKFRAKIYENCLSTWRIMYKDIPLKLEMTLGDNFFFSRAERESCLIQLQKVICIYGLEEILMQTPIELNPERISDKLPYGTSVRWIASLPVNILDCMLTFSYLTNHEISVFDMFYGYQLAARLQGLLELELLQNYQVSPNDLLKTPFKTYTLFVNTSQRCLYWTEI